MDIIPSFLDDGSGRSFYDGDVFNNVRLRVGEVKEMIYPEDKRSLSRKFIEYRVLVQHRSNGTAVTKMYEHCVLLNPLAGLADKAHWTLRTDKKGLKQQPHLPGNGSKVLLLCMNGESQNPVIIGGLRDAADSEKGSRGQGHHLLLEFNGVRFAVNQEGELTVTYGGKTDNDGNRDKAVPEASTGTKVQLTKDGSVEVSSKTASIKIDHPAKRIKLTAQQAVQVTAPSVAVAASSGMSITGAGVKTGSASDATMKGTSYRAAQQSMHLQLSALFKGLAAACSPGTPLSPLGPMFAQISVAVDLFEAQSAQFLSLKNKSD